MEKSINFYTIHFQKIGNGQVVNYGVVEKLQ